MNRGTLSSGCDCDANELLNTLLDRLERALKETEAGANGMPLCVVEAKLTEMLQAHLPGIRFTAHDVRAWAAQISS